MNSKTVGFVDLKQGYLTYKSEIDAAVQRVLDSGWYILGKEVTAFEEAFGKWCGDLSAIGVANGTDAIAVALRGLGVGPGDAVFTVSHTAVATVAAIELIGATPVLIDIDDTCTIDPTKLEDAIKLFGRSGAAGRPRAVVAVHLYGQPCDVAALTRICRQYGLFLVEDCAQAHGSTVNGVRVGNFGDVATFSFYPTKNLGAFGDGGAIATKDPELAARCRALRQYGWYKHYISDIQGTNSRLDEMQAAILSVRLAHLDAEIAARRAVAGRYKAMTSVALPHERAGCQHSYHLYVVRTPKRDALMAGLKTRGIASAIHYPAPVHMQKAYAGRVPGGPGGLEVTERVTGEILSLPMHPFLSEEDTKYVVESVQAVLGG